jgi:hypothetical protein
MMAHISSVRVCSRARATLGQAGVRDGDRINLMHVLYNVASDMRKVRVMAGSIRTTRLRMRDGAPVLVYAR